MPNETRSVQDLSGAQMGDHHQRDAAGRDIVHAGADADQVLIFLRDYVFAADQRRETAIKAVAEEIGLARRDMGIISDAVRSVRERLNDDDRDRDGRRRELDAALASLGEQLEAQAIDLSELRQGQRLTRRWLRWLTLALALSALAVAYLLYRDAAALAARATYDALAYWRSP